MSLLYLQVPKIIVKIIFKWRWILVTFPPSFHGLDRSSWPFCCLEFPLYIYWSILFIYSFFGYSAVLSDGLFYCYYFLLFGMLLFPCSFFFFFFYFPLLHYLPPYPTSLFILPSLTRFEVSSCIRWAAFESKLSMQDYQAKLRAKWPAGNFKWIVVSLIYLWLLVRQIKNRVLHPQGTSLYQRIFCYSAIKR